MSNQQYCLRWNNHQPNFISTFSTLFADECLVDVTLAAEGRYVQAHRVVLSACSSYFQRLFVVNPSQHPIVVLKDVTYEDLKSVVDFMYLGEVNVTPEKLHSVLKTAETLKIKGLADMPVTTVLNLDSNETHNDLPASLRRKRFKKSGRSDASSSPIEEIEIIGPSHLSIKSEDYSVFAGPMSTSADEKNFRNGCQNSMSSSVEVACSDESSKYTEISSSPSLVRPEGTKWPSDNRPLTDSYHENSAGISVITEVVKRRSRLLRQPHIVKPDCDGDENSDSDSPKTVKRPLGRQYSDPTPQQNVPLSEVFMEEKPNLLAVPPTAHLQKQNSDSALPFHRDGADRMSSSSESTREMAMMSQSAQPRSIHCPMLRPGPALGCNFCWNTIDDHGRILRRKTKYHCPECRTNLCIVPCFQDYHRKKESSETENDVTKETLTVKEESPETTGQPCLVQKHISNLPMT